MICIGAALHGTKADNHMLDELIHGTGNWEFQQPALRSPNKVSVMRVRV